MSSCYKKTTLPDEPKKRISHWEQSYCELVESENVMMIDLLNQIETIVSNNSLNLTKIEKANVNQTHPGPSSAAISQITEEGEFKQKSSLNAHLREINLKCSICE